MRRALIAVLLASLVAAGAGCGGGGDNGRKTYVDALNHAQTGLTKRFQALQARITPTSTPAQDQRTLTAYENAVRDTVRELEAVRPPDGFAALHRRFIGQVAGYGTALQAARAQLRSRDPRAILAAQGRLRAAIQQTGVRLNATIKAINDKLQG